MKAIQVQQFGGPEVLQVRELPDPLPGAGQVRIAVRAIGINPVETYIRSGAYARLPQLPYTPGTDASGVVDAIGPGVRRFRPGDRVYTYGSLAGTYSTSILANESQVETLPDEASFQQGAALGIPYATAHRALFARGGARVGETVLIHGASGGVGLAAVQLACAAGCRVFGTAGTEVGRALVQTQGAIHVLDHRAPDYLKELLRRTEGRGADLIVEMLANVNLARDLTVLSRGGRVVVVGSRGPVEINPREAMARDADIRGMILANASPEELTRIHSDLLTGIRAGSLRPVIGLELPLEEAPKGHRLVMEDGKAGKIVLLPG